MKRILQVTAIFLVLVLFTSVPAAASSAPDLTQEEILDLIMSGNDYLVGDGVPFDNQTSTGIMPLWASGGSNHTHQYIASHAFNVLYNDYSGVYRWYIDWGAITYILEGTDLPDNDETDGAFRGHFYDPDTGLNYCDTTDTAKSRFLTRYNEAVSYYSAGNYLLAWEYLGRAIHYLEDLNEPHHASNLIAGLSNHGTFEELIDARRTRFSATTAMGKYSATINSIPDICARNAKNNIQDATSAEDLTTYAPWLRAGDNTVPFAMQYVAVVLYKFQQDVS